MPRMSCFAALLVVAFSVASGCADLAWLRKKPSLPEALVDPQTDDAHLPDADRVSDKDRELRLVGDKSSATIDDGKIRSAATTQHNDAGARKASANVAESNSFTTALDRLSANPTSTPQDFAELRRSLDQPDSGLPPRIKEQFCAWLDLVERRSATGNGRDPVLLRPASADATSPTQPNRDPPGRSGPTTVRPDHEAATIAAPHVTVNVHAGGGGVADATSDMTASSALRREAKPDTGDTKSSPAAATAALRTTTSASPTDDRSRRTPDAVAGPSTKSTQDELFRPGEWRERVQRSIDSLDIELRRDSPDLTAEERARLATYLRLLYVVADKPDAAVAAIESPDKSQQQFWQHQLHALVVALDESGTPVLTRRAALALRELREAAGHLAALSALDLRNLAFCSQVDSFGTFTSFASNEFKLDQELLLYVEVDNFTVEAKPAGRRGELFETELTGSYQIFDTTGHRVADVELPRDKQVCHSRRRDYFIAYSVYLPKKIEPGSYTLQLTIEDAKASKFGQGSIEFKIKN